MLHTKRSPEFPVLLHPQRKHTIFPRLDALHVLDTSACFDAEWSGRNTFQTPSKFNIQIDTSAPFDARHATHQIEEISTQAG